MTTFLIVAAVLFVIMIFINGDLEHKNAKLDKENEDLQILIAKQRQQINAKDELIAWKNVCCRKALHLIRDGKASAATDILASELKPYKSDEPGAGGK